MKPGEVRGAVPSAPDFSIFFIFLFLVSLFLRPEHAVDDGLQMSANANFVAGASLSYGAPQGIMFHLTKRQP